MTMNSPNGSAQPSRCVYTVDEFARLAEFAYLTKSGVRHLIFKSQARYSASGDVLPGNGLVEAGAIIRIGRRVLIDAQKFQAWVESQRVTAATPG